MDRNLSTQLRYDAQKKSVGVAYVFWLFFGFLGIHRFYLGHAGLGFAQLLLAFGGFVSGGLLWAVLGLWWLIDAFLIPSMTERRNLEVLDRLDGDLPTVIA